MIDVLIIGGGPIGIACALEAQKHKLNYVIIEKGTIVNSLYHYPTNMQFFSSSEKLEIDNVPFVSIKSKPSKQEALEYYRRIVVARNIKINLFEKVENIIKTTNDFQITTSKTTYHSKKIIIATGFYDIPNSLHIPGEDLAKVSHYYNDPHYFSSQKVVIVGASNSAVDAALEIWRKGGDVTMVIRGNAISDHVKYWVRPNIENRIKEGSIRAIFNSELTNIHSNEVEIQHINGKKEILPNDFVLVLTGYLPHFDFLEKLGIQLAPDNSKTPQYDPETMETNRKGIYLAGVICGGTATHKWFIENSRIHANLIMDDILISKENYNS